MAQPQQLRLLQYFNDQGGAEHNGQELYWNNSPDGLPFKGVPGNLRKEELENAPLSMQFRAFTFNLADPEHLAFYVHVNNRIVSRWYIEYYRERIFAPGSTAPHVYLEWVQCYHITPPGAGTNVNLPDLNNPNG
jgi:hypothetical protein